MNDNTRTFRCVPEGWAAQARRAAAHHPAGTSTAQGRQRGQSLRDAAHPTIVAAILCAVCALCARTSSGAATQANQKVGVEEQLGKTISLDQLTFTDEAGQKVALRSLFDRPVILTLVYFRCPGICSPLLNELARVSDQADLTPGKDYRLVTISFDPKESHELAAMKRKAMLGQMGGKKPPQDAWRFLTGDVENIGRLADEVGFRYIPDRNGSDFVHPATVMFLTSGGKIVRYLNGLKMNPAELELAVVDAQTGRQGTFMQSVQQICYAYDSATQRHTLRIDRIILAVTAVVAVALVIYSLRQGRARRRNMLARPPAGQEKQPTP